MEYCHSASVSGRCHRGTAGSLLNVEEAETFLWTKLDSEARVESHR